MRWWVRMAALSLLCVVGFVICSHGLREGVLSWLTHPDLAITFLLTGALLVYLEFNLPGTVIFGAVGTLMMLLAIHGLHRLPLRVGSELLVLAALLLIMLDVTIQSRGALAVVGIVCLVAGLGTLVREPEAAMRVSWVVAGIEGTAFGGVTFALAGIAMKARREKQRTNQQAW